MGKTYPVATPQTSDEFNSPTLGLQWQWLANPFPDASWWYSLTNNPGQLRLAGVPPEASLVRQPNLLLQKIPAPDFAVTTKIDRLVQAPGEHAGLIIYGDPCAWIGLVKTATGWRVSQTISRAGRAANSADTVTEAAGAEVPSGALYLAFSMAGGSRAQFSYSEDGKSYTTLGPSVTVAAIHGSWIGAKFGLFAIGNPPPNPSTAIPKPIQADFDWIHITPLTP